MTDSHKRFLKIFWISFALVMLLVTSIFLLIAYGKIGYMPPIEELENPKHKFASEVITSDQEVLGRYYVSRENRVFVTYKELSTSLVEALIATEDARFLSHSGVDAWALMRSLVKRGIFMQKSAGGGSTITQQLAKQLYSPEAGNFLERLFQKPIEWVIAVQLERFYTKEEIVNMYFNKFDFLNNAVGVQSAALVYFGTTPAKLKIEEAATLVGMCKNPSLFNPVRFNERTKGRRNVVLDQMYKADYITDEQRDSLKALPLTLHYNKADHKEGLAPYFREYLRMMMTASKPSRGDYGAWQMTKYSADSLAWETNPLYGWCNKNKKQDGTNYNLYVDGLKIYTTIDSRMQRYAEEAVTEHIGHFLQPKFFAEKKGRSYAPFSSKISEGERDTILIRSMKQTERYRAMKKAGATRSEIRAVFNKRIPMQVFSWNGPIDTLLSPWDSIRYYKHFLRTGFMAMDPRTGHVKAYVGGIDFRQFQYDMVALGRRQVGSTIKPYLYTLAMEEGFTPCDEMMHVSQRLLTESGQVWIPRNANQKRVGEMVTLKWGLANSDNWVTAYLMSKLSPYSFVRLLQSFGIKSKLDPVVSLCLGPCEVTVEEMVSAYTAFANKGVKSEPLYVTRIEDSYGNVLANFTPKMNEVFSEETAYKMLHMLKAVVDGGTAVRLRYRYGITAPMGGKTGTTNQNADGWFMGFTPSLVSGMWVGGEDRAIHFDTTNDGQGANMALPIYATFIKKVYADRRLGYSQSENFAPSPKFSDPCAESTFKQNYESSDTESVDAVFE